MIISKIYTLYKEKSVFNHALLLTTRSESMKTKSSSKLNKVALKFFIKILEETLIYPFINDASVYKK